MRTRRVIFGIDFSGAKDEGNKIWIDKGVTEGSKLLESECLNARDLTNSGSRLAGTDEIKFWIMSWGASALVLEPESLKDEILKETEVILERYKEIPYKMAEEHLRD